MIIIKTSVRNITNENLSNIIFKIIFNNYKLNLIYKMNIKKKKYFLRLNIFYNSNVKSNTINAIFNYENKTNLIVLN